MSIYCVYLTTYKGSKLPPFYIGSSSVERVKNGYHGSVASKRYKSTWYDELEKNPQLFFTRIISTHKNRKEATYKECSLQEATNAPANALYINEAYAKAGFAYGKKQSPNHIKKRADSRRGKPSPLKGRKISLEHKKAFTFKGNSHSEKSKQKNRESHVDRKDTDETRQKKSVAAAGKAKPWLQNVPKPKEVIDRQVESRRKNRETWSDEKKIKIAKEISLRTKGKKKNYETNCSKKFVCRLSDQKEFSKASASKYLTEFKPYF